jgi:hypothetical protein
MQEDPIAALYGQDDEPIKIEGETDGEQLTKDELMRILNDE